jgi:hypothetical protein
VCTASRDLFFVVYGKTTSDTEEEIRKDRVGGDSGRVKQGGLGRTARYIVCIYFKRGVKKLIYLVDDVPCKAHNEDDLLLGKVSESKDLRPR